MNNFPSNLFSNQKSCKKNPINMCPSVEGMEKGIGFGRCEKKVHWFDFLMNIGEIYRKSKTIENDRFPVESEEGAEEKEEIQSFFWCEINAENELSWILI